MVARILKLADRIANVEEGIADLFNGRPSKVFKYFDEWKLFKELLYVPGEADIMWSHLDRLLVDSNYAQSVALKIEKQRLQTKICNAIFKSNPEGYQK